jgi:hypothetical protein
MKLKFALACFLAPLAAFALTQGPTARASAPDHAAQASCVRACIDACIPQFCAGLDGPALQQCALDCSEGCNCNCGTVCN